MRKNCKNISLTNWKGRQLILLHVELAQVFGTRKYSIGNTVTLVVLHVQRLCVDELSRT